MKDKYSAALSQRFDANETVALARELESIERQVTEVLYPDLMARDFIPLIPGIDPGADTYTWRQSDYVGEAKLVSNRDDALPEVDASLEEFYRPVRTIGDKYSYSTQELRAIALMRAKGSNFALDVERAKRAREMIERKHDYMLCFGDSTVTNLTGFLNDSNVTVGTLPFGGWATATDQQMLADLQYLERTIYTNSKQTIMADTLLLDPVSYALAAAKPLGSNAARTVLEFFKNTAMSVRNVAPWWRLSTADAGGTGPRAVCYKRDVSVAGGIAPMLFEAQPPQPIGLRWEIPCEARNGGTVIKRPLGVLYADGL